MQRFTLVSSPSLAPSPVSARGASVPPLLPVMPAAAASPASGLAACEVSEDSDASFNVAAAFLRPEPPVSWQCPAPTNSNPRWRAPNTRQCSLTASRITFNHAQTSLSGHESLHPVARIEKQGAFLIHAAGRARNDRTAQQYSRGPTAQRVEGRPSIPERGKTLTLELPQHTQKLVQDRSGNQIARRRRGTSIRHRRDAYAACLDFAASRRRQVHVDAHADHYMR